MKSGNWKRGMVVALALSAAAFFAPAQAGPIVTLDVTPPTIANAGDPIGVDIEVTGAPSSAGGFSLELDYGNLAFVAYVIGPSGTFGPSPLDLSFGDLGGTISFFAFADLAVPDEPALFALQNSGGTFTIAHIDFTGIAPGAFTLALREVSLSNGEGTALLCGPNNCVA
jgi:hypothetical protein